VALRPIVKYPDARLDQPCEPVRLFDHALRGLANDLLETMRAAPGVGITAAHIGVLLRVVVLEIDPRVGPITYINPEILEFSSETLRHIEGSVSMPGWTEEVERPSAIRFRYQDLDGRPHEAGVAGFHAVCIQHEVDQLGGIFWLRRLSKLRRDRLIRKWQKANRN